MASLCTTFRQQIQTYLEGLSNPEGVLLVKANSSPLQGICLLEEVGQAEELLLVVLTGVDRVADFVEEVSAALDPAKALTLSLSDVPSGSIDLEVTLRVSKAHMSALDQGRNLFKLVESVGLMVQHDAVEHFSEVAVQILVRVTSHILRLSKLFSNLVERFNTEGHI